MTFYSGSSSIEERESYSRGLVPLCFLWLGLTVEMGLLECESDRDVLVLVFYWLMVFISSSFPANSIGNKNETKKEKCFSTLIFLFLRPHFLVPVNNFCCS